MEGATVALFWGSILAQYIWYQRQYLYNQTKRIVQNTAKSIWKKTIKGSSQNQQNEADQKKQNKALDGSLQQTSNNLNQVSESKKTISKQKKIKKSGMKEAKNLRKSIRRYENWFLQQQSVKKMAKKIEKPLGNRQDSQLKFKRESCDFHDNLKNYDVEQLYEDYCLENEDQYNIGNILGYNPIISDDEQESSSYANNYTSRSSR